MAKLSHEVPLRTADEPLIPLRRMFSFCLKFMFLTLAERRYSLHIIMTTPTRKAMPSRPLRTINAWLTGPSTTGLTISIPETLLNYFLYHSVLCT